MEAVLYDFDSFLNCCKKAGEVTEHDLMFEDALIDQIKKKKVNVDVSKFNQTLDIILNPSLALENLVLDEVTLNKVIFYASMKQTTRDLMITRALLLVFALKDTMDILPFFPTFLTTRDSLPNDVVVPSGCEFFGNFLIGKKSNIFYLHLRKHLRLAQCVISSCKMFIDRYSPQYENIYSFIYRIIESNEMSPFPLRTEDLYFLKKGQLGKYEALIREKYPIIMPFEIKNQIFAQNQQSRAIFIVRVERNKIHNFIWSLYNIGEELMDNQIRVQFVNEEGVDAGGLRSEFSEISFKEIVKEEHGLFIKISDNKYWFNPKAKSQIDLQRLEATGMLLGLLLNTKLQIPIRFPMALYKMFFGREVGICDFAEIYIDCAKSCAFALNTVLNGDEFEYCYYDDYLEKNINLNDFTVLGDDQEIQWVNESNKANYVRNVLKWVFEVSIKEQYNAFFKGLQRSGVHKTAFEIFRPDEFDLIVSGKREYDWISMKTFMKYDNGYVESSPQISWFWEVFSTLTDEKKLRFLVFTNGSSTIPPGGFAQLAMKIRKMNDMYMVTNNQQNVLIPPEQIFPFPHTCFKTLDLPLYPNKEILSEKIIMSLEECSGFTTS